MISYKRFADNLHYCYHHYNCHHADIENDKKNLWKREPQKREIEREANFNDAMDAKRQNRKTNQKVFLLLRLLISTLIAFDLVIPQYNLYWICELIFDKQSLLIFSA